MEFENFLPEELDGLPVLPLPAGVLFPGIVIPMYVDEPCYQELVTDSLAKDRLVAMAMIRPGNQEQERPRFHDVAGVGRIIHCQSQEGGRLNILVQGMDRVRLVEELDDGQPYRRFRAQLIPRPSSHDLKRAERELVHMETYVMSLLKYLSVHDSQLAEVINSTADPIQLADILAATVIPDADRQQAILAQEDLSTRLNLLSDALADVLAHVADIQPDSARN